LGTGAELTGPLPLAQLEPCRRGPSALPSAALIKRCPRLDGPPGCWSGGTPGPSPPSHWPWAPPCACH